jgi:hypothetical protein
MKVAAEEVGTWGHWGRQVWPYSQPSIRAATMCRPAPDPQGNVPNVPTSPEGEGVPAGNSMP